MYLLPSNYNVCFQSCLYRKLNHKINNILGPFYFWIINISRWHAFPNLPRLHTPSNHAHIQNVEVISENTYKRLFMRISLLGGVQFEGCSRVSCPWIRKCACSIQRSEWGRPDPRQLQYTAVPGRYTVDPVHYNKFPGLKNPTFNQSE